MERYRFTITTLSPLFSSSTFLSLSFLYHTYLSSALTRVSSSNLYWNPEQPPLSTITLNILLLSSPPSSSLPPPPPPPLVICCSLCTIITTSHEHTYKTDQWSDMFTYDTEHSQWSTNTGQMTGIVSVSYTHTHIQTPTHTCGHTVNNGLRQ